MSSDVVVLPREWRLIRGMLRAVLALACLYAQVLSSAGLSSAITVFTAVFAAYSLVVLLWRKTHAFQNSLVSLLLETAMFVAFSVYGADRNAWIGCLFYLYLLFATVACHDWGDVFIVVGACLGFFSFIRSPDTEVLRRVVLIAGLLASMLAFQKRRLQERLAQSMRREEELQIQTEKVREAERLRIAGDFHDGPLQSFISLQVRLDILKTLMERDRAAGMQDLDELQQIAKGQVAEIRSFLRGMRPLEVDGSDLVASVRRIVQYFQKDTGIATRFVSSDRAIRLAPEVSQELLQILREALHNVQKHSRANRVAITVEQTGKTVEIAVDDDGAGFNFSGSFTLEELELLRLGPQSIKRRVRSLGGDLLIESRPGHGAGLKIHVPA